jgi:hypothetical protein
MKMAVFWVVAPCSLVEVYQRFASLCCLHHQGDCTRLHGARTQKTAIIFTVSLRSVLKRTILQSVDVMSHIGVKCYLLLSGKNTNSKGLKTKSHKICEIRTPKQVNKVGRYIMKSYVIYTGYFLFLGQ